MGEAKNIKLDDQRKVTIKGPQRGAGEEVDERQLLLNLVVA